MVPFWCSEFETLNINLIANHLSEGMKVRKTKSESISDSLGPKPRFPRNQPATGGSP